MKNILFTDTNQNVYINYTGSNSIIRKELYCIAPTCSHAEAIVKAMNEAVKDNKFIIDYIIAY